MAQISKPRLTLAQVEAFLQQSDLEENVITVACGIYRPLAEAEASVHGKTIETIHFRKVSDWDSMVDIVAAAGFISRLDCKQWRVAALPTGGGTVKTAHGDIPVPAPATPALLKGFEWIDDGVAGERVTPTGAAILRYLQPASIGSVTAPAGMYRIGQGCGTRTLLDHANVYLLNAYTAHVSSVALQHAIRNLEFDIDDMTGEEVRLCVCPARRHQCWLVRRPVR